MPRVVGRHVHFEDIKRVHVVKYHNFLKQQVTKFGKPLASNSINRKMSSVSSFFQLLVQRDVVDKNPVELCKRPKRINVRDTEAFNDTEMSDFFRLVIRKAPPLHKAALLRLFTTGMRNHELRSIKLSMFENREGVRILRYIGKKQKVYQVPIHPVTGYHLGQYLDFMASKGRPIGPDDYLFQESKCSEGGQASRFRILRWVISLKNGPEKSTSQSESPRTRQEPHSYRVC